MMLVNPILNVIITIKQKTEYFIEDFLDYLYMRQKKTTLIKMKISIDVENGIKSIVSKEVKNAP